MSKRSIYTIITPLPNTISRRTAVEALHDHGGIIALSPVVQHYEPTRPPGNAPADEFHCSWYAITDRISYLPGIKGQVTYKVCFHNLPNGMQSHCYAPTGLDIKGKWSVGGNEPGEEREVRELGLVGAPREGLYLREDVDMRCNVFVTNFVKKTLRKSHEVLVDRLVVKADLADDAKVRDSYVAAGSRSNRESMSSPKSPTGSSSRSFGTHHGRGNSSSTYEMPASPPYPDDKSTASRQHSGTYPQSPKILSSRSASGQSEDYSHDRRVSMPQGPGLYSDIGSPYVAELSAHKSPVSTDSVLEHWAPEKGDLDIHPAVRPLFSTPRPAELP